MTTITQGGGSGLNNSSTEQNTGYDVSYQLRRANVIDIILNPDDDGYSQETIGMIEYRYLNEKNSETRKAKPINSNIRLYPVKSEQVLIVEFGEESYYFLPLNRSGYINNNALTGVTEEESKDKNYADTSPVAKSSKENGLSLGDYFKSNRNISALMPYEGDLIFQGRFGNNIRMGSNPIDETNMPNIKIGNITEESTDFDIVEESLDYDNCIWITTDETLFFEEKSIPINGDGDTKIKSNTEDDWKGRQIVIFSDRIILQSKENEIIGYSNLGIHWACNKNFSVDTDDKVIINSSNNIETTTDNEAIFISEQETKIQSLKTRIGKLDADEPLVCGNLHQKILEEMLDILVKHIHPTGTGPSGPMTTATQLGQLKSKFNDTLSDDNFTTKANS